MAPQRDFQKVANSITREAIPAGMFNGKAKQLYDCLYSLTRGAIVPAMSVRISRAELMKKSGIGAKVTLEQNLRRLIASGLVSMKTIGGIQGGNEYTVYLPEEVTAPSTPPSTGTSHPSLPSNGQNLGALAPLETRQPSHGVIVDNTDISGSAKTSFKTREQTTDDEAFTGLYELFKQAVINLTGKSPTPAERDRWRELAELLIAELQIAAARTGQVSNVPAFLTEHLRRRLWKKDKAQLEREAKEAPTEMDAKQGIDTSKCPDCGGSGWWYPDGVERGVAKCKHQALQTK